MNKKNIIALLMLSTTVLSAAGSINAHASTLKNEPKTVQNVTQEQTKLASNSKNAQVNPADWTIDTSVAGVVKLNDYVGENKDIVIPTAKDLGHDGEKLIIDNDAFRHAISSSNRELGGTFATSKNGDKIECENTSTFMTAFDNKTNITSIALSNINTAKLNAMTGLFRGCTNLTSLDISSLDASSDKNSVQRLKGCTQLKSLKLGEKTYFVENGSTQLPDVPTNENYTGKWINKDNLNQAPVTSTELIALTAKDAADPQAKVGEWVWEEVSPASVQPTSNSDMTVSYDYTAPTPAEPAWYSVVPADVAFTDTNKDVDTTVKLVNADDKNPYSGSKHVDVTVKSDNAYKLKDADGDQVDYKLDKDGNGGTFLNPDNTAQKLGTLAKGSDTILSKAHLTGTATKTGKYIDTLHYVFAQTD